MKIALFTTGGTIDKIYFDALSEFIIGEPQAGQLLLQAGVDVEFTQTALLRKDSIELTDQDRMLIAQYVSDVAEEHIIVTHGTDTMVETGRALKRISNKTIVLVGAMQPAAMRESDAAFNLGFAVAAVQLASTGVYIAMNGQLFDVDEVRKDRDAMRFVATGA
ncbi:asparaginase [Porticoccaceae bacterium]|nr:asparaginase [Porticoccaceae bacterium]